jgi:dipeptidyl aminopeptidase/acylaminoacyl peptidase
MRIPFGVTETSLFWGTDTTNGGCVGCHSLADDAERLVVTHHGVNGRFSVIDIEDPLNPIEIVGTNDFNKATFKTISPDGEYILGFNECRQNTDGFSCGEIPFGEELPESRVTLYSIETGLPITYWDFDTKVSHPDWSPDGNQVVFVRANGEYRSDMEFAGGEIVQRDIDLESLTFDNEVLLKSNDSTYNFYYPAYSPDGDWIAYNRAQNSAPELCKSAPDAELWLMSRDGAIDMRLDNANGEGNVKNSYPRWGPLPDDDILWLAYSSQRQYPLRYDSSGGGAPPPQKPQIWVAAIQPDLAFDNEDPSSPPFWLPGQVPETDNHLPVWWSK